MASSQRYLPQNLAIGSEGFPHSLRTTRTYGDPPESAVRPTRGRLPGAKIGASERFVKDRTTPLLSSKAQRLPEYLHAIAVAS